jgi:hypothetical protein
MWSLSFPDGSEFVGCANLESQTFRHAHASCGRGNSTATWRGICRTHRPEHTDIGKCRSNSLPWPNAHRPTFLAVIISASLSGADGSAAVMQPARSAPRSPRAATRRSHIVGMYSPCSASGRGTNSYTEAYGEVYHSSAVLCRRAGISRASAYRALRGAQRLHHFRDELGDFETSENGPSETSRDQRDKKSCHH